MELKKEHIYFGVACLLAGAILGAGLRSCTIRKQPPAAPAVIHDTITINDTVRLAGKTKIKYITPTEEEFVIEHDTVRDTVRVPVPIEHKEYRDTFCTDSSRIELGVQFSGYKANIDNVDLQYHFEVEPRTIVKRKGWGQFIGVGIGVGYGASVVGQTVYAAPEIGLHITYGWGYHW